MKLNQFIRNECANWSGGNCTGVTPLNKRFQKEGPCKVLNGEKCSYFKSYVMPIAEMCDPVGERNLRSSQAEAIRQYEAIV